MVEKSPDEIINDVCKILSLDVDKVQSYLKVQEYCDARCIIAHILYNDGEGYNYRKISSYLKKARPEMARKAANKCRWFIKHNSAFREKYQMVIQAIN